MFPNHPGADQVHLRILETTDLHCHIQGYDYYADAPQPTVGLTRTATLIAQARTEAPNTLLFDNGDTLQGNPMGDFVAYERGVSAEAPHPVIAAMNALGYDGATVGNHDFNYGLDFLLDCMNGAAFPVVSANIARSANDPQADDPLLPPFAVLERRVLDGTGVAHDLRIGVIGFVPPQIMQWDRRNLEGRIEARDMVEAAQDLVPELRRQGVDLVIALSHSGIGEAAARPNMENASVPLAAVDGVDVVLAGHTHLVFPDPSVPSRQGVDPENGTLHGKPAVMAGFWGSHLGVIDLLLEKHETGWRLAQHRSEVRPITSAAPDQGSLLEDPATLAATRKDHEATLAYVRRPVGRSLAPLHSYFALVGNDPATRVVHQSQRWFIRSAIAGTEHEGLPVLSAATPFKAGGRGGPGHFTSVEAGDLAMRHIADLYIYPNSARALKVTGADILDWLEHSASVFRQITPGSPDQVLLDPDFPSYTFDTIAGVDYEIDVCAAPKYPGCGRRADPEGGRIRDLTFEGVPVTPETEFVIATNSYRVAGTDFPVAANGRLIFETQETNRDILRRYIAETGEIDPGSRPDWRFAAHPETSVLFDTGPRARGFLAAMSGLDIEDAGNGPGGFARFRINL
ncbi:MAG: bifunctional 2',3'-cyclic-nucleotide 2'-phosphodiesterase/3'-nucleotidase [Rhodobacteraceae bacterium]|nr:bifunctional 2',3'-cyclic-nucleotide 2'-phosphodiesterase/3'-nucleotidase [Paracoccaceae bacterium]